VKLSDTSSHKAHMKSIFNVKRNYLNGKSGIKKQNKYSLSKQAH